MIKHIKNNFIFSLHCILALSFIIFIFENDSFVRMMCPEIYWKKKINKLESSIRLNSFKVDELKLCMQKEDEILKYDLDISQKRANSFNEDQNALSSMVKKGHEEKKAFLTRELEYFEESLNESQVDLETALEKYEESLSKA